MLVALSDTHADTDPQLTPHLADVLDKATAVVHAGDFTSTTVLEAFEQRVTDVGGRFTAVHGNADSRAVSERLPATALCDWADLTVLVVHGHRHDRTHLSVLARERDADLAVVGHTHRQEMESVGELTVMNPGSHAAPRGGQAGYGVVRETEAGVRCELRTVDGEGIRAVVV